MNVSKEYLLSVQDICVSYRKKVSFISSELTWPIKGMSFDIYYGETIGIVGSNGSGKSTLLRVLAGVIMPDKGKILGKPVKASLLTLQLGFVPALSGRENIILGGMLYGMPMEEIREKIMVIIDFAELSDIIDQPLCTYSNGMRARLGFSVAYHADPDIILIDEVLGVGDEGFRKKSTMAMKQKINSNKTVIIVSHNMNLLREVCDRVVWIKDGRVQEIGEAKTTIKNYLTDYVS